MTEFELKVLECTKRVPRGKITSYKELAKAISSPKSYRAVGNALNKNPWAPKVPCHRVVKSDGCIGGFAKEIKEKIVLLQKEGILIKNNKIENLEKVFFRFKK